MIANRGYSRTRLPPPLVVFGLAALLSAIPTAAVAHDSLGAHMATHITIMNVLAPLCALALLASVRNVRPKTGTAHSLLAATLAQITVLWVLHTPSLLAVALSSGSAFFFSQALLFCMAFWFWLAIFSQQPHDFWRSLLALLITGKLFCLLGALLVFAPRSLYPGMHTHSAGIEAAERASQDQQLAGLLMLIACPLSYVAAAIIISSRALRKLETPDGQLTDRLAR